jgi:hypothetical protein
LTLATVAVLAAASGCGMTHPTAGRHHKARSHPQLRIENGCWVPETNGLLLALVVGDFGATLQCPGVTDFTITAPRG